MTDLTQAQVLSELSYDPETGVFVRLTDRGPCKAGEVAGGISGYGYRQHEVCGVSILGHRLAWLAHYGRLPDGDLDHINGDRCDNRIANLREVNRSQNLQNVGLSKKNSSGRRGVSRYRGNKWQAYINAGGRRVPLGQYSSFEEAVAAREQGERDYFTHNDRAVSRQA